MTVGKFERNAAVHLAKEISDHHWLMRQYKDAVTIGKPWEPRTPFDIMKEALARLDIDTDTDDTMVHRYVTFWVQDGQVVNEFVSELRK